MNMNNVFEEIANITKAHAYDTISPMLKELQDQNREFRIGLHEILLIISKEDVRSIIENPAGIIGKISNHCNELLTKNRPLSNTNPISPELYFMAANMDEENIKETIGIDLSKIDE